MPSIYSHGGHSPLLMLLVVLVLNFLYHTHIVLETDLVCNFHRSRHCDIYWNGTAYKFCCYFDNSVFL